ncbi:RNA polymerase sigma-70 factor [Fulvivirgaceae bacterium BMA12]|uniref:RNA polymerase sigma-70 factor n=1 Tax=Agaribacillus aureus TaxID=3051825 RepID=A0ABT8L4L2_9BACT|nr:RNA polymerase sigma-70 factor [Fulvivirgaceae bacterium BMA12]
MFKAEALSDLLRKIRMSNDERSFEIVFHHYFDKLFRIAFSIVKKHEIAEEVVEDVLFKFWQMKDGYPFIKNLDSYLFAATKNGAYDHLKKNAKYTLVPHDQYSDTLCHFLSPERSYLVEELKEQIEQAVSNLPPKCRMIFELSRHKGQTNKLTAETLGVSVKTVENQMTIAIKKIAKELKAYLHQADEVPYSRMTMTLIFGLLGFI